MTNEGLLTAIIAASIGTLGSVIAKDTKVSEFRQQWIDALRNDVSRFSALAIAMWKQNQQPVKYVEPDNDAPLKIEDVEIELETVAYRIVLRLDLAFKEKPDKKKVERHRKVLEHLSRVRTLAPEPRLMRVDLNPEINDLHRATAVLLDEAWETVKRGEKKFRYATAFAFGCLVLSVLVYIAVLGHTYWMSQHPVQPAPTPIVVQPQDTSHHVQSPQSVIPAAAKPRR